MLMNIETLKTIIIEGQELLDEIMPVARDYELEPSGRCLRSATL